MISESRARGSGGVLVLNHAETRTVLFTDLRGSTAQRVLLGDDMFDGLRHAFETCLNHVPSEHVNRLVHLVNGQLDSEFAGEMPDVKRICTEQRQNAVAASLQYLPTFARYFDGLLNAAALPPEDINERALAYDRLARIAAGSRISVLPWPPSRGPFCRSRVLDAQPGTC